MKTITNLIEAYVIRIKDDMVEYLLLKRSEDKNYPNIWQMVTGKVKGYEKAYEAVLREVKEETELIPEKLFVLPNVNSFYNDFDDTINLIPVFVCIVASEANVILSDEHQEFKWVSKNKAKKMLAWPGQLKSVDIIHDFFSKNNENINFIELRIK